MEQSIRKLTVESGDRTHDRILQKLLRKLDQSNRHTVAGRTNVWKIITKSNAGKIAAAFLLISSWAACFVLLEKVVELKDELAKRDIALAPQNINPAQNDDSATINFYLEEHRDLVAQHASASPAAPQPAQMRVNKNDILYYESFDNDPDYMNPGIIVRGPSSQHQIDSSEAPVISNGHTLTLSEAEQAAGFDVVLPAWLDPGYALDQIRRIEGRDALQLLYTDGINSVSLFEQPLDGKRGLEPKDFREYAVYRNKEQAGGTILAWKDSTRSYVLIGNTELSQLMNMAQSISATK